ncbi:hypothetical protein THAOC_36814, partial [Thalassiosira oceanica]
MDESLLQRIRAAGSRESMEFTQQLKLPYGDGYVDASVCCGTEARPLSGVGNQPNIFPRGSFLQLPETVQSYETANNFIRGNMPGCEVKLLGGVKRTGSRLQSWTLACKCHATAKKLDPNDFKEGCVGRKGTKIETVKRSDYDHMGGCIVEATEAKRAKKKKGKQGSQDSASLPIRKKAKVERNRTGTFRPREKNNRCMMKVHIFQNTSDQRYYVRSDSNLIHNGHPPLPASATKKSSSELTADDIQLIELLNGKIGPQSIANVINERHDGAGEFLSTTIYSKLRELERLKDLEKGISSDMSVAEKTLKHLEHANISHFYVMDDPLLGLVMHSRPRGRPPSVNKFVCSDEVKNQVSNLRTELGFNEGTKILLLLSLATDEMIRLVTAYPEVFFMDITAGTNRQKRGMFLAVVKDSYGKT